MVKIYKRKNTSVENRYPRIKISIFPISKPDFKKLSGTKEMIIFEWLSNWIVENLKSGEIKENNLLPLKADLAYYFGVGEGTVQNAIRRLEDNGLVVSKQRIGTLIASRKGNPEMVKLTSKREKTVLQIKKHIWENGIKPNTMLPSMKKLVEILGVKRNTLRSALDYLAMQGIIKSVESEEDNKLWLVISELKETDITENQVDIVSDTLVQKISAKIEKYIVENLEVGERLDAISVWAKRFNVSDKTVYDAVQMLCDRGIITARRGRYGTVVLKRPNSSEFQPAKETSIFMPAEQAAVYSYQRIENFIRNKIKSEYEIGQKLPSMQQMSELMDVSTNTIRKAIMQIASEGYVRLVRGRFGGIYVMDIPEEAEQSFKWLAVNPQYVKSYRN